MHTTTPPQTHDIKQLQASPLTLEKLCFISFLSTSLLNGWVNFIWHTQTTSGVNKCWKSLHNPRKHGKSLLTAISLFLLDSYSCYNTWQLSLIQVPQPPKAYSTIMSYFSSPACSDTCHDSSPLQCICSARWSSHWCFQDCICCHRVHSACVSPLIDWFIKFIFLPVWTCSLLSHILSHIVETVLEHHLWKLWV